MQYVQKTRYRCPNCDQTGHRANKCPLGELTPVSFKRVALARKGRLVQTQHDWYVEKRAREAIGMNGDDQSHPQPAETHDEGRQDLYGSHGRAEQAYLEYQPVEIPQPVQQQETLGEQVVLDAGRGADVHGNGQPTDGITGMQPTDGITDMQHGSESGIGQPLFLPPLPPRYGGIFEEDSPLGGEGMNGSAFYLYGQQPARSPYSPLCGGDVAPVAARVEFCRNNGSPTDTLHPHPDWRRDC